MLQKSRSGLKINLLTRQCVVLNEVFSYIKCSASHHTKYMDIFNNVLKIWSHNTSIRRRRSEGGIIKGAFGIALCSCFWRHVEEMKLSHISQFIGEDTQQLHRNVSMAVAHSFISSVCKLPPHHRYLQGPACICHLLQLLWRANETWARIRILNHFHGAFLPLVSECLQEMKLQLSLEEWFDISQHSFFLIQKNYYGYEAQIRQI